MHHSFDISIAEKHGVNPAIFLNNMAFWIQKNIGNEKHFYENQFWTYNSVKAFKEIFPYWSTRSLRTTIEYCIKKKLVIKGNFNKAGYDRTTWYAFTKIGLSLFPALETASQLICQKRQMDLSKTTNAFVKNDKPIPDVNTNIKTDIKEGKNSERFSLSVLDNFNLSNKTQRLVKKHGINEETVKQKFKNHLQDKDRKTFKVGDLENWFIREIEFIQRVAGKGKKDSIITSNLTAKEFVPQNDQKKYSSKDTAKAHVKAIKKALGKSNR